MSLSIPQVIKEGTYIHTETEQPTNYQDWYPIPNNGCICILNYGY